jgi:hypothetical protein
LGTNNRFFGQRKLLRTQIDHRIGKQDLTIQLPPPQTLQIKDCCDRPLSHVIFFDSKNEQNNYCEKNAFGHQKENRHNS